MTDLYFDMILLVYILNKRQQFKDSTLQNDILGHSAKNTDILMFRLVKNGIDGLRIVAYTPSSFI